MIDFYIMGLLHLINRESPRVQQLIPVVCWQIIFWFIQVSKTNLGEDAVYNTLNAHFLKSCYIGQLVWHMRCVNERVKLFLTFGYNEIMTGRKLCHFSMKMLVQILSFLPSYFLYNASTIAKMTDI